MVIFREKFADFDISGQVLAQAGLVSTEFGPTSTKFEPPVPAQAGLTPLWTSRSCFRTPWGWFAPTFPPPPTTQEWSQPSQWLWSKSSNAVSTSTSIWSKSDLAGIIDLAVCDRNHPPFGGNRANARNQDTFEPDRFFRNQTNLGRTQAKIGRAETSNDRSHPKTDRARLKIDSTLKSGRAEPKCG